jgi:two-component system response regulator NreC
MYKIFIADDHTMIRQGLRRILEEVTGYKVIGECGDGLQVMPQLRRFQPDMIMLDISLPNLRGIELIKKIRKFDKGMKILVLTMHKNEEYVYECLTGGAQGYILKEDADSELISAIGQIQSGKIYVSSSFTGDVIKNLLERNAKIDDYSPFRVLSSREREILKLTAEGDTNKKIAVKLSISNRTVEHHRANIMKKIGVKNVASLIKYAVKAGLVDLV